MDRVALETPDAQHSGAEHPFVPDSGGASFSEFDLTLLNALQISPRGSWAQIGTALGVDATTASRRWRQLSDDGQAWITAYPVGQHHTNAYVTLECTPEAVHRVGSALCGLNCAYQVERTDGKAQYFAAVATAGPQALDDLVHDHLSRIPGVVSIRAELCLHVYHEGGGWQPRTLDSSQRAQLTTPPSDPFPVPLKASDRPLLDALSADGRCSYAELADRCGVSETTVRRRLGKLTRSGQLAFRCDMTQQAAGWPLNAIFEVDAGADLDRVGRAVSTWPEIRLCASTSGRYNLIVYLWLRSAQDCRRIEERLVALSDNLRVDSRRVTLRPLKRMGRLLGPHGAAVGHVPLDVWRHSLPGSA
ncbi:Lrp/AsnC family transcriptional regulator [Rhodococcus opacus]|nr:Lrp/AsnC family transcriptional regulator [Rhodococcus opacus]